jgi:hypothetical protein
VRPGKSFVTRQELFRKDLKSLVKREFGDWEERLAGAATHLEIALRPGAPVVRGERRSHQLNIMCIIGTS